jgi:hypothetical protein
MSTHRTLTALSAALLLATPAFAQVAVTADVSTYGAGAHLVVPMEKTLNGRFGLNGYSHRNDKSVSAIDYQLKTSLRSIDLLFDWYVLDHSAFHLTGGLIHNNNQVKALGKPDADGNYIVNGYTYTASWVGKLEAEANFRRTAPYLGIGWGNPLTSKGTWSFMADAGAFLQGRPHTTMVNSGCTVSKEVCATVSKEVAAERAQFNADLNVHKVYPVLRASLAYRF